MTPHPSRFRLSSRLIFPLAIAAMVVAWNLIRPRTPVPAPKTDVPTVQLTAPPRSEPDASAALSTEVRRVLDGATREELLAALQKRQLEGASLAELQAALHYLARSRPALAAELALALGRDGDEKYQLARGVLDLWTAADSRAAWDWSLRQPPSILAPGDPTLPAIVLDRLVAEDPKKISEWIGALLNNPTTLAPEVSPAELAQVAVQALMKSERLDDARQAVEQWARSDGAKLLGNAAFEEVTRHLATQSTPEQAALWLKTLPLSEGRNYALGTLAAEMVGGNPPAALNWAIGLSEAEGRVDALQRAFGRWVDRDAIAATEWLAEHEADPVVDRLIVNLVNDSMMSDAQPRAVLTWAQSISDPQLRQQNLEPAVLAWGKKDPVAAWSYVETSGEFSAEQKTRILSKLSLPATKESPDR